MADHAMAEQTNSEPVVKLNQSNLNNILLISIVFLLISINILLISFKKENVVFLFLFIEGSSDD